MKKHAYLFISITLLISLTLTAFPAQEAQSIVIPDTLTINGDALDNIITITDTTIQLDANPVINYSGIDLIVVNGLAGNDLLIADLTGAIVSTPISFNGGDNNDTLQIQGDPGLLIDSINCTPGPANDAGQIITSGSPSLNITFTGLEPVIDLVPVATLIVNATGSPNTINYLAGSVATQGIVAIDAYETIEFGNKTNLVINAMDAADTININNPSAGFPTSLTVNGDNGVDTTNINNNIDLAANLDIVINTEVINFAGSTIQTLGTGIQDFNGPMTLNGDTTFSMEANCEFDYPIGGLSNLIKSGSGTLTLSGSNTYSGDTIVQSGTLMVTGSIEGGGDVDIYSGAALGGTGDITGIVINNPGGIIAPGLSPGCLTIIGQLNLDAGSTLSMEINGATACTQHDRIDVTGTISLGGATLNLIGGFAATPGTELILIDNDLADFVTGTFSGLPQGSVITLGAFLGRISYTGGDGNDVSLTAVGIDYGDAPDPTYPTLLASNGARHILGTTVFLGNSVDLDVDGQPDATATGDDTDGNNDDDGVVFTSALVPNLTATVDVNTNAACTLSAWIDFNGNGSWADAGEDLFPGGTALVAGANSLSFPVPTGATIGSTFARFRGTTDGAVTYTGQASDGEVEDYEVEIVAPATLIVEKQTNPDSYPGNFTFTGDAAGTIADDGSIIVAGLAPGTYTSTETVPANWALTSIVCVENGSPNSSGSIITGAATFVLEPGETCTCTFNNTALSAIGDLVWEDLNNDGIQNGGEPGLAGVQVDLHSGSSIPIDTTFTDGSGNYQFIDLLPGFYTLAFHLPPGFNFSPQDQGADDNLDSDVNTVSGMTGTAIGAGEVRFNWDAGMWQFAVGATGDSADAGGGKKDSYTPNETVYAIGSGFSPFGDVHIYVVPDRAWTDGDLIGPDISNDGINIVAAGTTGSIGPIPIWDPPLDVGEYDIVFDANRDGFYNAPVGAAIDVVDDPNHPGFVVIAPGGGGGPTVGGKIMLINKSALIAQWIAFPIWLMIGLAL